MESLAKILNRSVRTIQRHLHVLKEAGLIEFVERRRWKGRFSSYTYKILHIATTTGHGSPVDRTGPNRRRTKHTLNTPKSPRKNVKKGYEWLFGEQVPADTKDSSDSNAERKQNADAARRTDGYEWLFK
jgi:DNA-binding transcriptional ArsR family regulator